MADLPSGFWSGWIIAITITSLVALLWLVLSIYFPRKNARSKAANHSDPVWDESLSEGAHPPPLWWFWLIFSAMIISVIYLMLFPGLGAYKGLLNWSQDSRLESSYTHYNDRFENRRNAIATSELTDLQNSEKLMDTAERIFANNCAACHGTNGRGQAKLFPNLKDIDWQWGGSPDQIEQTIRFGRTANMMSWQETLGDDGVEQLADYLISLRDTRGTDANEHQSARLEFKQKCAACHGVEAKGNPLLGAPNLSDNTWLYGKSKENIQASIANGRQGVMPAFEDRLDDTQIRLLVAWLAR